MRKFLLFSIATFISVLSIHAQNGCDQSRYYDSTFSSVMDTLDIQYGENIGINVQLCNAVMSN